MDDNFVVIAIDGPSGTGKSTLAKSIASELNFGYLDTGALYRAVAVLCRNLDPLNWKSNEIQDRLKDNLLNVHLDPSAQWVKLNDNDITNDIRSLEISDLASQFSRIPVVRESLLELQHNLIKYAEGIYPGIVIEGRDIGTVVVPNADFKFFLNADESTRIKRRSDQLGESQESVASNLIDRDARDINREISPLVKSVDAIEIDTSNLSIAESMTEIFKYINKSWLPDDSLDPDDFSSNLSNSAQSIQLPVVSVLGRPNVGKSTLVNRLVGTRLAVTEDTPGVTRDRVMYACEWNGRDFMVMDTGGWDAKATGMYGLVSQHAEQAIAESDLIVFVIDAQTGATDEDISFIKLIRKSGIKTLLVANKVDTQKEESDAAQLWNLGLGEPHLISALHGRGAGDFLDLIVESLPKESGRFKAQSSSRSVAILGRPNVGKSSLLNKLLGADRSIVSDVAGTTVDPIDEYLNLDGKSWLFIDTAGIRKKFKQDSGHEYYAVLRTQSAIDRAELVIVVIDATHELSDQDRRIINLAQDAGRAIMICFNKWDQVDEERRFEIEREIDLNLQQQRWIPKINISALTGRGLSKLTNQMEKILENWSRRISTSALNKLVSEFVMQNPHPIRSGRQPKILFATQISSSPPTFALFATRVLDDGYIRFLERRLRESFDFEGTPIRFKQRIRNSN